MKNFAATRRLFPYMETHPAPHHPIILFDGVCNLCHASVQWVIEHDPEGIFRFASLQSEIAEEIFTRTGVEGEKLDSVALFEEGRLYQRSTAALRIARKLDAPWSLLFNLIVIPAFIRDAVYDLIARNRYRWFGRRESCMVPSPELKERFLDTDI